MHFAYTPKVDELRARLTRFMDEHVYPNEPLYWDQVNTGDRWKTIQIIEDLKPKARAAGDRKSVV